jgi:hypothetical protein
MRGSARRPMVGRRNAQMMLAKAQKPRARAYVGLRGNDLQFVSLSVSFLLSDGL